MDISTVVASKVSTAKPVPASVTVPRESAAPDTAPETRSHEAPHIDVGEIQAIAKQIESYLKSVGRSLDFRVDQGTGRTVVTVRDSNTGDIIRQIPSEEVLQMANAIRDGAAGLVDVSA